MKTIKYKIGFFVMIGIILFSLFLTDIATAASKKPSEALSMELIKIKTRSGVKQKFIIISPTNPVASVIFFKGGKGLFELKSSFGKIRLGQGKKLFDQLKRDLATKGFVVAVVDAPSDKSKGMYPFFRISKEHTQDIEAIVSYLIEKTKLPVWLFGHSFGTISATHGVIHTQAGIDGLVLASPVTETIKDWGKIFDSNPNGIMDMDLGKIKVPTLLVYHKDDKCTGTPPSNIPRLKVAIENSKTIEFTGGITQKSKPCGPAHRFSGIEKQVYSAIAEFIKSQ